jgi:tRNA pseudouridine13 synthase
MIIRRLPEDFVVRERLTDAFLSGLLDPAGPIPPGGRAVYRLKKTSLTTPEAIARLAKAVGIKAGSINYAGLKDKHAVTEQFVSVPIRTGAARQALPVRPIERVAAGGIEAGLVGFTRDDLAAAAIRANTFDLVIREIQQAELSELDRRADVLKVIEATAPTIAIVNYFGDQRFGSARHGEGFAAAHLARGDFEAALRLLIATPARKDTGGRRAFTRVAAQAWGHWDQMLPSLPPIPERRCIEVLARGGDFREAFAALPNFVKVMCIEAFQSHLWNATARRMVESLSPRCSHALLRTADEFGEMVFPAAPDVPASWFHTMVPMPAADVAPAEPWAGAMTEALDEMGLDLAQLRVPGLRRPAFGTALRPLMVRATEFSMDVAEPDDLSKARPRRFKRRVRFELPRGAYATVVLRALGQT